MAGQGPIAYADSSVPVGDVVTILTVGGRSFEGEVRIANSLGFALRVSGETVLIRHHSVDAVILKDKEND